MKTTITFISIFFYALLSSGTTSKGDNDRQSFESLVEIVELEYEDLCENRAEATWNELVATPGSLTVKLERDKMFGIFSRTQTNDIKTGLTDNSLIDSDVIRRKMMLLSKPGDVLLDTEDWIKLVTFGDSFANKLRVSNNFDCGNGANCTLRELHSSFARQQDEAKLRQMKQSWEDKLPDVKDYMENILPILNKAAQKNEYESVEDYWNFLTEYEGALLKARELWEKIKPLYMKLHKYIALRLKGPEAVGKPLPVHVLRSLTGDDWLNIIENLLPNRADIYQKVYANIQLKNLGGIEAFKEATKLIKELNFGDINNDIWSDSLFNSTCPTSVIDFCKSNKVKAITCKDVSLGNFLEAHEAAMKIKYKQTVALYSNNSYILREANRYSAVYEALSGFTALIALNPHALDRSGLYPIGRYNYNPNHHRIVLQLITALRDLPKLNYYLAADEWRLSVLKENASDINSTMTWSEFRQKFSLLETSDADLLGDPNVLFNKPYIGNFMGVILKYQIYQSFAEELKLDESDLVKHVADKNQRIMDAMLQGYTVVWPEMISDLLAKRENALDYTALTDYYTLLDEYLDKQIDLSKKYTDEEYVEPIEPTNSIDETEDNEIPSPEETEEKLVKVPADTHENILDNIIDTAEESNSKFSIETSTVGVLEIKNPVAPGDQTKESVTKESSYSTYWWIGVVVAIAIIVILIAIIAKKRHNHRKQLERQRRDNSHA